MIRRLHHTGFVVRDRARAVAFYRDVVGLKLISEYERIGPGIDQVIGYEGRISSWRFWTSGRGTSWG